MTIAALRALLVEIDQEGGPEAARQGRLQSPDESTEMTTTTGPLPEGPLLDWADEHQDPDIRGQAARARAALAGLRGRYEADQELTAITTEAEQLEKRLAELRAREAELVPARPKNKRKPLDYPVAEVRAWAAANGIACPARGRIPKTVVDAWTEAQKTENTDA
ncbi:Lsr2 family protein [Streptomyces murinus]|uniref:Lsr2 family DNA-binding protein n=1 Tax=Streptomyces murinus TaxID=33900 RepID=UPI000A1EFC79|nr:histone-like nucleoid-structuring protein Lsr2 [Streptomyces murinus]WDO09922.1 Lsr2 family protein [Streptomyces murinus]